jgi:hypothetical protein
MQITFTLTEPQAHVVTVVWAQLHRDFPGLYADPSDMLRTIVEDLLDDHVRGLTNASANSDLPD